MRPLPNPADVVVVDASVLIAGLMADGRARRVLLHSDAVFFAPPLVLDEVHRRTESIAQRAGLAPETVTQVLDSFDKQIEVAPDALVDSCLEEATRLAQEANAHGDADYIALALALDAPIWTYDHDFHRVKGLKIATTSDVEG